MWLQLVGGIPQHVTYRASSQPSERKKSKEKHRFPRMRAAATTLTPSPSPSPYHHNTITNIIPLSVSPTSSLARVHRCTCTYQLVVQFHLRELRITLTRRRFHICMYTHMYVYKYVCKYKSTVNDTKLFRFLVNE